MSDAHPVLAKAVGASSAIALMPFFSRREFIPGEPVMRHGESVQTLFFVCSGTVVAKSNDSDDAVVFGTVGPGQWLGEIGIIDGGVATATVIATSPVVALQMDGQGFSRLQQQDPRAFSVLLTVFSRGVAARLRRTTHAFNKAVVPEDPATRRGWVAALLSMLAGSEASS